MQDSSSATTHFCGPAPNKMFGSISGLGPICAILVFLLLFALRRALHRPRDIAATSSLSTGEAVKVLRADRVSVAIRRLVHYSWYGPAGERPRWAGTNWKGSAGQGPAIRTRQALVRQGFPMSISICSFPR